MSIICFGTYGFEFNLELICTSEFFKKLKLLEPQQVQINSKLNEKNRLNMKKFAWRNYQRIIRLKPFFPIREVFSKFPHKILVIILRDIIGLEKFI